MRTTTTAEAANRTKAKNTAKMKKGATLDDFMDLTHMAISTKPADPANMPKTTTMAAMINLMKTAK